MCIIVIGKQTNIRLSRLRSLFAFNLNLSSCVLFSSTYYIKHMIKLGSNVKSKIHDDLTGHVVVYQPLNNYAVVMTDIMDYEMMTVECFLSDLELA